MAKKTNKPGDLVRAILNRLRDYAAPLNGSAGGLALLIRIELVCVGLLLGLIIQMALGMVDHGVVWLIVMGFGLAVLLFVGLCRRHLIARDGLLKATGELKTAVEAKGGVLSRKDWDWFRVYFGTTSSVQPQHAFRRFCKAKLPSDTSLISGPDGTYSVHGDDEQIGVARLTFTRIPPTRPGPQGRA